MIILFFIFFFHFLVGALIEVYRVRLVAYIMGFVVLVLTLIFTLGLTYTADYDMYYYFFKYEFFFTDFAFRELSLLFKRYKLSFQDLFIAHLFTYILLYFFFIRKFTINYFYVFLAYIILDYVHFSNQIRYFLGFPILLFGFYFLYQRKYLPLVICCVLAFLSHSALVVLFVFIPIYLMVKTEKYLKLTLIFSAICFGIMYAAFTLGLVEQIDHFGEYFGKGAISSFTGGVFNAMPYFFLMGYLYFLFNEYRKKNPNWVKDKKIVFLYKLSFFTIVFIPSSFFVQIAGHRYVMPFMIIYTIFVLYMLQSYNQREKIIRLLGYSFVCFLASCFIYVLPEIILNTNHFGDELDLMLKSIDYLNYTAW